MSLAGLSVKRPVAVLMVVCIILLLGAVSFMNLPLDLFPEMNFPIAAVITTYSGAAPQEVENMVTRPLEQSLATVQGVESISSISSAGTSVVLLEFDWGQDLDFAMLDVRESIDMVRGMLPGDADDPWVMKADPSMMPIVQLSFYGEEESWELKRMAEDVIKPRLERVEGVASVDITGGQNREIKVVVSPEQLNSYGISLEEVSGALARENVNVSGGNLQEGNKDFLVRSVGEFTSLDDIRNLVVSAGPNERVLLQDVAVVEDSFQDVRMINRFNGEHSIGININKQSDANTVSVSNNVWRAIDRLETTLPAGVQMSKVIDQADFINDSIQNVFEVGIIGAFLAVMVLILFLRNFRSTLVVALSIPVSIVATFVLMYFYGMTINIISLGGLALGLGIMVDSSIVVLENIFRFRQGGSGMIESARDGTDQVSGAIIAATLTTVVVFVPVVFVEGFAAQVFSDMALTVSFSLLAALAIALTVVPVLSSKLLSNVHTKEEEKEGAIQTKKRRNIFKWFFNGFHSLFNKLEETYRGFLRWSLNHRKSVVVFMIVTFVGSFVLVPFIGAEFLPTMDEGYLQARIELPTGSTLEESEAIAMSVQNILAEIPEIRGVNMSVGGAGALGMGTGDSSVNVANLEIILTDLEERDRDAMELVEVIRSELVDIPGATFNVSVADQTEGMTGAPVSIAIRGDELHELERISALVAEIIESVEGTREVTSSFEEGRPEVQVFVNRERAAEHGLSSSQVASILRTALGGQVSTRYREAGREYDVRVELPTERTDSLRALGMLSLMSPYGYQVPVEEVSTFAEGQSPMSINRYNQVRTATVTSQLSGRSLNVVMEEVIAELEGVPLPEGYVIDYEGEQQMMQDSFEDLAMALILAIFLVYMIMAAQFESLIHPFIIMFALPQTFTGVALALFVTGRSLSVPAFIGIIMLAGIVVNNGIVLVDYINKVRDMGRNYREAILEAGPVRLRPIMMTTMTTVLAMFPMSLGLGSGAEMSAPMATVVIGGLLFSTILTLVIIPVIYSILEDAKVWIHKKLPGNIKQPNHQEGV